MDVTQVQGGSPEGEPPCEKNGEGGIRTLGRIAPTPVFETGPFGRSGTSPYL